MRKLILAAVFLPAFLLAAAGQLPVSKTADMLRMDVAAAAYTRQARSDEHSVKLIVQHPYLCYSLGESMGYEAQGNFSRESIRTAPRGTCVITDSQLWPRDGGPGAEELTQWGYELDQDTQAEILRISETRDVTAFFRAGGQVSLWKKMR